VYASASNLFFFFCSFVLTSHVALPSIEFLSFSFSSFFFFLHSLLLDGLRSFSLQLCSPLAVECRRRSHIPHFFVAPPATLSLSRQRCSLTAALPLSLLCRYRSLSLLLRPILLNGFHGSCRVTHETYRVELCLGL
jgi:hypothetical protein